MLMKFARSPLKKRERIRLAAGIVSIIVGFGVCAWFRDPQSGTALWKILAWLLLFAIAYVAGVPHKTIEALARIFARDRIDR